LKSHILLVASKLGYQIRSFDEAASRLGFRLSFASDRCHVLDDPWGDRAVAVSFEDPAAPLEGIAEAMFDGILAVGDRPALAAAHLAESLGLSFHPPAAVAAARNKFLSRGCFRSAGMKVPKYLTIPLEAQTNTLPYASQAARLESSGIGFPCVLKPLGLSGSRGVIRANNPSEFDNAFGRIRKLLDHPDVRQFHDPQDRLIQVEEFIPGREFAIEGIMTRGSLQVLAIFDKPDPLDGPFFEETIYVTPSRESSSAQAALIEATEQAVAALGLYHGPIHAEMRLNDDGVWMLEVAGRPIGGLCAGALRFCQGDHSHSFSLEELLLRHAASQDLRGVAREPAASGVLMIPVPRPGVYTGIVGVESALACPGVTRCEITAKEGQSLLPLPEGAGYPGFLFARGERPEHVELSLRKAHACLALSISPVLPIVK